MATLLGEEGVFLDDIVFCPHHPDSGYPEENPDYKIKCACRKPGTEMIDKMVKKYNIDIENSFIIGDTTIDVKTGINANAKTILLNTGLAGNDKKYKVKPNYIEDNLLEAVNIILSSK